MNKGLFITFEGTEGCGKSTQNKRLQAYFKEQGKDVVCTHEPGGTPFGLILRKIILDPDTTFYHYHTELLLFLADRLEHVEHVIKPALKAGKIVICDRYIDSTFAYQMGGRRVKENLINYLNELVDLKPDITLLMDIDPEEGLRRAKKRASLDRFEKEEIDFHNRVQSAYHSLVEKEPHRMRKIDVNGKSEEEVFALICKTLGGLL
jgi:dTMP kinase